MKTFPSPAWSCTPFPSLIADLPEARATTDLDFFLKLEAFIHPDEATAVRTMLDTLGFTAKPGREYWQFTRPLGRGPVETEVLLDVLARAPEAAEQAHLRVDDPRVRPRGIPHAPLHGRVTPEAFAVEDSPLRLPLPQEPSGTEQWISVPHVYPWLCLKTVAACDWWRQRGTPQAHPGSEKHAFDVYLLVAMLTESELEECSRFQERYAGHQQLAIIHAAAAELFQAADAPGFLQAARTIGHRLAFDTFHEGYRRALGL